jgi:Ca2+-binding EF-hand superfamily protein
MPEAVEKETGAQKLERERRECFDLFDKTNSGKIQRVEIGKKVGRS